MEGHTIDTLSIKINSSSESVSKSIDSIIDGFSKLSRSLEKFSHTVDASGIGKLSDSFEGINKALSGLDTSKINEATKSMRSLKSAASGLGKDAFSGFANMAGRNMKSLIGGIRDFGKGLIISGQNADYAGNRYKGLALSLGSLYLKFRLAIRALSLFNNAIGDASSLIEVQNVVDTTFGKMSYKIEEFSKNAIKDFGMSELSAKQFASQFQAMGTAMGITGQQVKKAHDYISTIKTPDGLVAGYNTASDSMADMSINLTKLSADMASFYNVEQSTVAKALQSGILSGNSRPLRQWGLDLTQATLQEWALNNGLDANIKSMSQAEKTMLRYTYVMAHATAAQNDFKKTQNSWHNSITTLKQELQQLGIVIGSGLIQAIKPFVVQMNVALSGLIKFAQNVVNALGKIFGWEMEVNTKGLTIDDDALEDIDTSGLDNIGDSADNATKSVKKLKDQLQGFDKLNVLRTTTTNPKSNKSDSGNGSGDSGAGAVSNGDVTAGLKKTKGLFESDIDNLFDLGRYISNALSKQLEKIPWKEVYEKARGFGKGLAEFLNGLITPRLFENLGKTTSKSISTAFHFLDSFGQNFNWANFGNSIGAGINGFLKGFDWITILSAAKYWGQGLATTINRAVATTDFKLLGKTLAMKIKTSLTFLYNFANTLDFNAIGKNLADAINGFIKNFPASQFANTIDKWVQGIYNLVVSALSNIKWGGVKDKIKEFIKNLDFKTVEIVLGTLALKKGPGFAVVIGSSILKAVKDEIALQIADALRQSFSIKQVLISLKNISFVLPGTPVFDVGATKILEALWDSIYKAMPTSWSKAYDKLDKFIKESVIGGFMNMLEDGFKNSFNTDLWDKASENFKKGGIHIVQGLGEGLIAGIQYLTDPVGNIYRHIWKTLCDLFGISSPAESMKPIGKYIVEGILEGFKLPDIEGAVSSIAKTIKNKWETVKSDFGNLKTDLENKSLRIASTLKINFDNARIEVGKHVGSLVSSTKTGFKEMKTYVDGKMGSLKDNISKKWIEIKSSTESLVGGTKDSVFSKAKSGFESIKNTIGTTFSTIKKNVSGYWDDIRDKAWNKIADGKNTVLTKVTAAFEKVVDAIKAMFPISISKWLKLPKIEVETKTWDVGGHSITLPVGIKAVWYKKAYDNPFMFTKPTLMPDMRGFGDGNGGEMVYGHANLMNDIREASGGNEMTNIGNRQLALQQQEVQVLRQVVDILLNGNFGRSDTNIFETVRNQASCYTMRTGKGAFEY